MKRIHIVKKRREANRVKPGQLSWLELKLKAKRAGIDTHLKSRAEVEAALNG